MRSWHGLFLSPPSASESLSCSWLFKDFSKPCHSTSARCPLRVFHLYSNPKLLLPSHLSLIKPTAPHTVRSVCLVTPVTRQIVNVAVLLFVPVCAKVRGRKAGWNTGSNILTCLSTSKLQGLFHWFWLPSTFSTVSLFEFSEVSLIQPALPHWFWAMASQVHWPAC